MKNERISTNEFLAGVALAIPFYAEFISWYISAVMILPFLFYIFASRNKLRYPHCSISTVIVLMLFHCAAIYYSQTVFQYQVIKDLIIASLLVSVYIFSKDDVSKGFFIAIIPLGILTAILGLFKAALLDRGYLIGFIYGSCDFYPAGSALCVNYNNLGLLWLVAALGCIKSRLWIFLPILIAAGALVGSRRFLVLMIFMPIVVVLIYGRSAVIKLALISMFTAAAIYFIQDPNSFEKYRFGKEPYTVVLNFMYESKPGNNAAEPVSTIQQESIFNINRTAPFVMLGTMTDGTLGTASRLDFWSLAFSELSLLPQGWSYHKTFSCTFSRCVDFHYPHMPVMSEWLIGGAFLGIVSILFYIWPLWSVWHQKSIVHIALLFMALPYSLISGDTVFSLPIYMSSMLVALSSVPRKARSGFE